MYANLPLHETTAATEHNSSTTIDIAQAGSQSSGEHVSNVQQSVQVEMPEWVHSMALADQMSAKVLKLPGACSI